MKVGSKVVFYLFGIKTNGIIYNVHKDKTVDIKSEDGYNYPKVQTFKTLPKRKKEIPPWYILK